ncbi:MAG: SDR family oxidoreductase [Clostridiaceae bacterium]|nr:SDR family oxidoreductase [Clostridiaceae bacterium]
MDLGLKDKVVVVTGSTGGIGEAIVEAFLREGAKVACTSTRQEKLDRFLPTLDYPADQFKGYVVDVRKEDEVAAAMDQIAADFGGIDIVIPNAGYNGDAAQLKDATDENWRNVFDINVFGVMYSIKHALKYMLKNEWGSVVVIGSEGSYVGSPEMSHYCASKHAVMGLVMSAATEVGPEGIHCNFVAPSAVDTDMMRRIEKNIFGDTKTPEEAERFFADASLNKRYAKVEEVADVTVFLASKTAAHIMGYGIRMDGGKHIQ